jgi:hypothetical protein
MSAWRVVSNPVNQVALQLDIEMAYDHVNCDFLLYMLRRCGFGEKLCS